MLRLIRSVRAILSTHEVSVVGPLRAVAAIVAAVSLAVAASARADKVKDTYMAYNVWSWAKV
jgi:hypothetical protein